jgi:hypothetical protein
MKKRFVFAIFIAFLTFFGNFSAVLASGPDSIIISASSTFNPSATPGNDVEIGRFLITSKSVDAKIEEIRFEFFGAFDPKMITNIKLFKVGANMLLSTGAWEDGTAHFYINLVVPAKSTVEVAIKATIKSNKIGLLGIRMIAGGDHNIIAENMSMGEKMTAIGFPVESKLMIFSQKNVDLVFTDIGWQGDSLVVLKIKNQGTDTCFDAGQLQFYLGEEKTPAGLPFYPGQLNPGEEMPLEFSALYLENPSSTCYVSGKIDNTGKVVEVNEKNNEKAYICTEITESQNIESKNFNFWPNPCGETLNIFTSKPSEILIFDLTGKVLKKIDVVGVSEINISDLKSSIYLLQIRNESGIETKRLVKQ